MTINEEIIINPHAHGETTGHDENHSEGDIKNGSHHHGHDHDSHEHHDHEEHSHEEHGHEHEDHDKGAGTMKKIETTITGLAVLFILIIGITSNIQARNIGSIDDRILNENMIVINAINERQIPVIIERANIIGVIDEINITGNIQGSRNIIARIDKIIDGDNIIEAGIIDRSIVSIENIAGIGAGEIDAARIIL